MDNDGERLPLLLTPALLDEILFAMEDQEHASVLDLSVGRVVSGFSEDPGDSVRVLPIPEWTSLDGFQAMRSFAQELRHPELQAELHGILDSGQGVFKAFKAALKVHEPIWRRWLVFKRRVMEKRVQTWVYAWEGTLVWNGSDAETELPFSEDFRIEILADSNLVGNWRERAWEEVGENVFGVEDARDFRRIWENNQDPVSWKEGDRAWAAVGPDQTVAGLLWARPWFSSSGKGAILDVLMWYVLPEFRGLGLGRALWQTMRRDSARQSDSRILFRHPCGESYLEDFLRRQGQSPQGIFWTIA